MKLQVADLKWEGKSGDIRLIYHARNGYGLQVWRYDKSERRHVQLWPRPKKEAA